MVVFDWLVTLIVLFAYVLWFVLFSLVVGLIACVWVDFGVLSGCCLVFGCWCCLLLFCGLWV